VRLLSAIQNATTAAAKDVDRSHCMMTDVSGCGDVVRYTLLACTAYCAVTLPYAFHTSWKKRLLFKGIKPFKRKPNAPQFILFFIPFVSFCMSLGLILWQIGAATGDNGTGLWAQILMPWVVLGCGGTGLCYCFVLYILFWLQVLEIKKLEYDKKAGKKPVEIKIKLGNSSEGDEQKNKSAQKLKKSKSVVTEEKRAKLTKAVLNMARSREKITLAMEKFCIASVVVSLALNIAAGLSSGGIKMILFACNWVILMVQFCPALYVLLTLGYAQVMLYDYWGTTLQYYINTGLIVFFFTVTAFYAICCLPGIPLEVFEIATLCLWVLMAVLVPTIVPGMLAKLMNIPYRAAKKKEDKKNGRFNPDETPRETPRTTSLLTGTSLIKGGITTINNVTQTMVSSGLTSNHHAALS